MSTPLCRLEFNQHKELSFRVAAKTIEISMPLCWLNSNQHRELSLRVATQTTEGDFGTWPKSFHFSYKSSIKVTRSEAPGPRFRFEGFGKV